MIVKCSKCGNSLMEMPEMPWMRADPGMKQWFGNVCTHCKRVFCNNCIKVGGPTPCPNCDQPTDPAQLYVLQRIGIG